VHNEAWESSIFTLTGNITSLILYGFSVAIVPFDLKLKIKKSKTAIVQRVRPIFDWFDNNGIKKTKHITLYKKVSNAFKTQEGTENETLWEIGSTVTHPNWSPAGSECGAGKFHACSRPYFCDEFRNEDGDKYIAVKIKKEDLHEWPKPNPSYPHKIAFREGTVLYECDKYGTKTE